MNESPRSWVLPEEPVPVRLMGTIWADTDGLHDDLDTPFGLAAWMALARTSLPVPVLPLMKMVMSVSATSLA